MGRGKKKNPRSTTSAATSTDADIDQSLSTAARTLTAQQLPKLRISAGKSPSETPSHSTTPTVLATPTVPSTPTTSRALSRTGSPSSPEITPPPDIRISRAKIDAAVKGLIGRGAPSKATILKDFTDSEDSSSEVQFIAEVHDQPLAQTRRQDKRKRGASDVSRDQVSSEEALASDDIIDEEEVEGSMSILSFIGDLLIRCASELEISFQIPFEGAVSSEIISSEVTWIEFRSTLADTLSLAPSEVKVAYRFSVHPRSTLHTHLRNADDLTVLFDKARIALDKHEKSRSAKDFFVELKDLNPFANEKGPGKGKKKTTKKKKASLALCSMIQV
jgi:hypothetical protein